MSTIYLNSEGTVMSLAGERLVVQCPAPEKGREMPPPQDIFIRDVSQVTVCRGANVTMPALFTLMEREIPVVFARSSGSVVGFCLASAQGNGLRRAQYAKLGDQVFLLAFASQVVQAKIRNQRRMLQRLAERRGDDVKGDLQALEELLGRARAPISVEILRGIEGAAAARYFEWLNRYFPQSCPFERRSRQPPHNAVNALLSYGYMLLTGELEVECLGKGLDPTVGFYHTPEDRRPSLALDLLEPLRAAVSDSLALDLVNHQTLKAIEHFDNVDGGVYLN